MSQYGQQPMSQFGGPPQLPFMPFAGGPGSVAGGSDYGGAQIPMAMPFQPTGGSMYGMMMPQHTGSVYGMPPPSMMGMGMYGPDASQSVLGGPSAARPMSTFSMATSVNAFAGPSQNTNPTDDELFNALRIYLSTQDLMTVTKKYVSSVIVQSDCSLMLYPGLRAKRLQLDSLKPTYLLGRISSTSPLTRSFLSREPDEACPPFGLESCFLFFPMRTQFGNDSFPFATIDFSIIAFSWTLAVIVSSSAYTFSICSVSEWRSPRSRPHGPRQIRVSVGIY
jgi:hypothetical protein